MGESVLESVVGLPAAPLRPLVSRYRGYCMQGLAPRLHRGLPSRHLTVIISLGAAVLAFTAAKMIVSEPLLDAVFDTSLVSRVLAHAVLVVGVLAAGWWTARRSAQTAPATH